MQRTLLQNFAARIKVCGAARDLRGAIVIYESIVATKECWPDRFLANLMIDMYGQCGDLERARKVFNQIPEPNQFSWTALLVAYTQSGHIAQAKDTFDAATNRDKVTWNSMISAYAQRGHYLHARQILDKMPCHDLVTWNTVVKAYTLCKSFEEANNVFCCMREKNVITWTTMMAASAEAGHLSKAWTFFERMPQWDVASWNAAIQCSREISIAKELFDRLPERSWISWTALALAYGERGGCLRECIATFQKMPQWTLGSNNALLARSSSLQESRRVFLAMPQRDQISWNALLQSYIENGCPVEAMGDLLLGRMPCSDVAAWNAMIQAFAQAGDIFTAEKLYDKMPEKDVISLTAMLVMYAEAGNIEQASMVFNQMHCRDPVAWNSMIKAFANGGILSDALSFLSMMLQEGIKANDHTYRGILSGCNHAGLPEECRGHFLSMVDDHGICPELDHYCCVVDSLGRSKRLDWAEDLVQSMPYVPNEVAWTSLIGACRVHGDSELMERFMILSFVHENQC